MIKTARQKRRLLQEKTNASRAENNGVSACLILAYFRVFGVRSARFPLCRYRAFTIAPHLLSSDKHDQNRPSKKAAIARKTNASGAENNGVSACLILAYFQVLGVRSARFPLCRYRAFYDSTSLAFTRQVRSKPPVKKANITRKNKRQRSRKQRRIRLPHSRVFSGF